MYKYLQNFSSKATSKKSNKKQYTVHYTLGITYCLSWSCLSTSHQVPTLHHYGYRVLLYWSGFSVVTLLNTLRGRLEEPALLERAYVPRRVSPRYFAGYVVVAIKVDSGVDGFKYGAFVFRGSGRNVDLTTRSVTWYKRKRREWVRRGTIFY